MGCPCTSPMPSSMTHVPAGPQLSELIHAAPRHTSHTASTSRPAPYTVTYVSLSMPCTLLPPAPCLMLSVPGCALILTASYLAGTSPYASHSMPKSCPCCVPSSCQIHTVPSPYLPCRLCRRRTLHCVPARHSSISSPSLCLRPILHHILSCAMSHLTTRPAPCPRAWIAGFNEPACVMPPRISAASHPVPTLHDPFLHVPHGSYMLLCPLVALIHISHASNMPCLSSSRGYSTLPCPLPLSVPPLCPQPCPGRT